ncbi:MAG: hypothetical protein AVDCRST_MAG86-1200 [uncultured Truepera sp.]|uniref:SCP domain-containing protein n=1 Tax=uncultured Truepera sp. TaxID=543023 RepID=A0A6J4V433_9DEIN|nr:MAG: hypothetical protein AVDCRST_MAG86-1200 [uncultured Truepera sp.]
MADLGYFSHTSPLSEHATLALRVAQSGGFIRTLGENLALVGSADTAQASVGGWLASPGHRADPLHARFTHVGFGAAAYPDGRVAVAQVLGYQPATLRGAQLVSVLAEAPLLELTVSLSAPGETAVFYGEHSSPPQTLAAGTHILTVPLSDPPTLPLPVGLGLRAGGAAGGFILQDDGWLHTTGWRRSRNLSGAQARLLKVTLSGSLKRTSEFHLDFASAAPALSAWKDETLLPLRTDGTRLSVELTDTQNPVHVGEAHPDGRYAVIYSFLPNIDGAPSVLPLGE